MFIAKSKLYNTLIDKNKLNTEYLEKTYEMVPAHVYFIDRKGMHTWVNKRMREDLSGHGKEIIGLNNFQFLDDESAEWSTRVESGIMNLERNEYFDSLFTEEDIDKNEFTYEEDIYLDNGDTFFMQSVKTPVLDLHGESHGILGFSIDITHRKRAENSLYSRLVRGGFSNRQAQCMLLLIKGQTASTISNRLDLSKRTIEFYISNMKKKFKCKNTPELVENVMDQYIL